MRNRAKHTKVILSFLELGAAGCYSNNYKLCPFSVFLSTVSSVKL